MSSRTSASNLSHVPPRPTERRFATRDEAVAHARTQARDVVVTRQPEGWSAEPVSGRAAAAAVAGSREALLVDAAGALHTSRGGQFVPLADGFTAAPASRVTATALPAVPATKQLNHGRNVEWTPTFAFRPGRDIEQLVDIMKWVSDHVAPGLPLKAAGSKHSWSPAAATNGVSIQPTGLTFIEPLPQAGLFRVGSGTRIRELNQALWQQGRSLPVLGGFDGQTVGGVLPTGTHGSVLSAGPLAERLIKSIDLVTPQGEKVRLEPRGGLTDPEAFARTNAGWKLIQDDEVFDAAKINVGTFGVVHSYVLDTVPRFFMKEVRTETTGEALQQQLAGGNIRRLAQTDDPRAPTQPLEGHPPHAYHLEFLWNPHSDKAIVTSRQPLPEAEGKRLEGTKADAARPSRSLFRTFTMPSELGRPRWADALFTHLHGVVSALNDVALEVAPKMAVKSVDSLLSMMVDPDGYVARSYNVFNIGDGPNQLPAQSATLSVPLEGDQYLEAMSIIRDTARKFAEEKGQYQTGPISLRFVKGSTALLGDPVDVCKFEIIFSGNDKGDQRLARELTQAYDTALRARFGPGVRVHFGQLQPNETDGPERLKASFPGFERFEAVRRSFDPTGRMLNAWQKRLFGVE
ncbi:MAG: FAD-binding protein [Myxococcaceae bacterium]|nr:FAD-binding protein [Myxococcaceae bacterium]